MATNTPPTAPTRSTIYFAYGSNLSPTQMHARCPHSVPFSLAHLPGWEWIINQRGYANVVKAQSPSAKGVYGVVYHLPPADEELLDGFEGVPVSYQKAMLEVEILPPAAGAEDPSGEALGKTALALVYVDSEMIQPDKPRKEYVRRMNRGIREATEQYGLPEWYVDEVMRKFIPKD